MIDFICRAQIRKMGSAWFHGLGNSTILILEIINWSLRFDEDGAVDGMVVTGNEMILSIVCAIGVLVTAWVGGEMTFKKRVGASPTP